MQFKRLLPVLLLVVLTTTARAQQGIAVNATGNAPDASAMLDVQSTAKGMLVPRMSALQRTGITTPANGLLVYDTDSTAFYYYTGATWAKIATGSIAGDNLGNHTATQNLNMNGKVISVDGSNNGLAMGSNGQIVDSGVNGAGTDLAASGAGTRMIWYPKVAAFRAGAVDGSQWDNNNIGAYSVAMGYNNIANGPYSAVFGNKNIVSGEGAFTTGWLNNVSGPFGAAFGQQNSVGGYASGTVGLVNNIAGGTSFGAGYAVSVTGQTSMAMGRYVSSGGDYSLAFGYHANAAHTGSIVMGDTSNIILATDGPNQFKARYQGGYTFYADGTQTNGLRISPTTGVAKYFNNVASSYDARSLVDKNYVDSNVTAGGHDNLGNHTATQTVKLNNNWLSNDGGAEGIRIDNNGLVGVGTATPGAKLDVSGNASIGNSNVVTGANSMAVGNGNTVSSSTSFAAGGSNNVSGNGSYAVGGNNVVTNINSMAIGLSDTSGGYASFVANRENNASGNHSAAFGYHNQATSFDEFVIGMYSTPYTPTSTTGFNGNDRLFNVGNGTTTAATADALTILKNGKTGINNNAPAEKLDVKGNIQATTGSVYANNPGTTPDGSSIQLTSPANDPGLLIKRGDGIGGQIQRWDVKVTADSSLTFRNNNASTPMVIRPTGNVGIGTTNPTATLKVAGTASLGGNNVVTGGNAVAVGTGDTTSGYASFAVNRENNASGNHASAFGNHNLAPSYDEFVIGAYSTIYTPASATGFNTNDRLFNVGNGTGSTATSDAFTILKNGKTGIGNSTPAEKLDVVGNIKSTDTVKTGKFRMTNGATAGYILTGDASGNAIWTNPNTIAVSGDNLGNHTATQNLNMNGKFISADGGNSGLLMGSNGQMVDTGTYGGGTTLAITGAGTRMMWLPQRGAFRAGVVDGNQWNNSNIGGYSVAMGINLTVTGGNGAAFGSNNNVSGAGGFSAGAANSVAGTNATAFGQQSSAGGYGAFAAGLQAVATGGSSFAGGHQANATGAESVALGEFLTASGQNSVAIGRRLTANQPGSMLLGDTSNTTATSDAANQLKARFKGGYKLYADEAQTIGLQVVPTTGVAKYFSNVASSYDAQSLVDKNYVDSNVSSRITGIIETDPQVSSTNTNKVPKWNGTTLVDGQMYDDGTNIGIGTNAPNVPLHVMAAQGKARIQSTNDLPTYLALTTQYRNWIVGNNRPSDNNGALDGFYVYDSTATATRLYIDVNGNTGIGTTTPGAKLDVVGNINSSGQVKTNTLQMTNGANAGYVLTSDAAGNAAWTLPAAAGTTHTLTASNTNVTSTVNGVAATLNITPAVNAAETDPQVSSATTNSVPKWNGTTLVDGTITDNGNVGIGTTSPGAKLDVNGIMRITGTTAANLELNSPTTPTIYPNGSLTPANQNMEVRSAGGGTLALNFSNAGSIQMAAGGGGVLIGTGSSVAAKLDVNGTFKAGTNGTVINSILRSGLGVTGSVSMPAYSATTMSFTFPGATTSGTVIANPTGPLGTGFVIAYSYISPANQVNVVIQNVSNTTQTLNYPNLFFTIIN